MRVRTQITWTWLYTRGKKRYKYCSFTKTFTNSLKTTKHSPTHSGELYLTLPQPKESAAASHRSSHGLDLKYLDKLARNTGKFTPSVPNSPNVQAYLQDIDFHLEMRPNITDKDRLYLL